MRPLKELSDNHRRSIAISLRLLDKALSHWSEWADGRIPFGPIYQQGDTLSPAQKTKLRQKIAEVREIIGCVRDDLHLEPDQPSTTQLIVGEAHVLWEMLAELNSRSLGGYGAVSTALADYVNPVGEKLAEAMNEIARLCA